MMRLIFFAFMAIKTSRCSKSFKNDIGFSNTDASCYRSGCMCVEIDNLKNLMAKESAANKRTSNFLYNYEYVLMQFLPEMIVQLNPNHSSLKTLDCRLSECISSEYIWNLPE